LLTALQEAGQLELGGARACELARGFSYAQVRGPAAAGRGWGAQPPLQGFAPGVARCCGAAGAGTAPGLTPRACPPPAQWERVSRAGLGGRRPLDCRARWLQQLAPGGSDAWEDEELQRLAELVELHGEKSWRRVSWAGPGWAGTRCLALL
jgi:hypothetical protein